MPKIAKTSTLGLTVRTTPYVKELRLVVGSLSASILWQQLEYWFTKTGGEPFYKFFVPQEDEKFGYKAGDSWCEELFFTEDEFRAAFDKLGEAYNSKSMFSQEEDPFKGKMYASYFDRKLCKTFYFRNHELVSDTLENLEIAISLGKTTYDHFCDGKLPESISRDRKFPSLETGKVDLYKPEKSIPSYNIQESTPGEYLKPSRAGQGESESGVEKLEELEKNSPEGLALEPGFREDGTLEEISVVKMKPGTPVARKFSLKPMSEEERPTKAKKKALEGKDELTVFEAFKAICPVPIKPTFQPIIEGIPRALRIFKERHGDDAAKKLLVAFDRFKEKSLDYYKENMPYALTPSTFFTEKFVIEKLLTLAEEYTATKNYEQRGMVERPKTEEERREIARINRENIARDMERRRKAREDAEGGV